MGIGSEELTKLLPAVEVRVASFRPGLADHVGYIPAQSDSVRTARNGSNMLNLVSGKEMRETLRSSSDVSHLPAHNHDSCP